MVIQMMINAHTDFLPKACMCVALALFVMLTTVPAFAQVDLAGVWAARNHEDLEGMLPGDYTGLPINDEARTRADAWLLSYQAMPERQCIMYTSHYVVRGPQSTTATTRRRGFGLRH